MFLVCDSHANFATLNLNPTAPHDAETPKPLFPGQIPPTEQPPSYHLWWVMNIGVDFFRHTTLGWGLNIEFIYQYRWVALCCERGKGREKGMGTI